MDLTLDGSRNDKERLFIYFDVPVFYIPYGVFPLRNERQTGFLFPKHRATRRKMDFGSCSRFSGRSRESTDATVAFDFESARLRSDFSANFARSFDRNSDFG